MTKIFVFSTISGGYFVSQTALVTIIREVIPKKPTAMFGNSGGGIANLLSMKYSGTKESIERVLYSIDRTMFIKPWVSETHPFYKVLSPLASLFQESFYKSSDNQEELFNTYFTESELKDSELWVGTYDITSNFTSLLCTGSKSNSIFENTIDTPPEVDYLEKVAGVYKVEFANGDIGKISKTLAASSSIPGYKPPVEIDNSFYVDGGVSSPSPGSSFVNLLTTLVTGGEPIIFFYVIGDKYIDKDIEMLGKGGHWGTQISRSLKSVLNSSIYRERQLMLQTWVSMIPAVLAIDNLSDTNYVSKKGKDELKAFYDGHPDKHMFITCYSKGPTVDIINFTKEDLRSTFHECYDKAFFEIYYL